MKKFDLKDEHLPIVIKVLKMIGAFLVAYPLTLIITVIMTPSFEDQWLFLLIIDIILFPLMLIHEIKDDVRNIKNDRKKQEKANTQAQDAVCEDSSDNDR